MKINSIIDLVKDLDTSRQTKNLNKLLIRILLHLQVEFSLYYENKERFPDGCATIKNVHITTFKSAKGLEFDTVIIPNFDILKRLPIIIQDRDTGENKIICDWKDLYVACTRAKSNLYLISNYDIPSLNSVVDKTVL